MLKNVVQQSIIQNKYNGTNKNLYHIKKRIKSSPALIKYIIRDYFYLISH